MKSMRNALSAMVLGVFGQIAVAQQPADQPGPTDTVVLKIPQQPIGSALNQFAQQSGLQVMLYTKVGQGIKSSGIAGAYTPKAALALLLADAPLRAQWIDDHTVMIQPLKAGEKISANDSGIASEEMPVRVAQSEAASSSSGVAQAASTFSKSPEDGKDKISEITVTAQKRQESLKDVPISISVLNGADLNRSSIVSVTEALSLAPGVTAIAYGQGGGTQLAVRGVGAANALSVGSSPIAYYLDSVPFGFVKGAFAPDSSAYDLQRVEILRGPQGTLYGASAQGGVVRVLTNDANADEFELTTRTALSGTKDGGTNYRGDLAVNVPIVEGKLAIRAVVGYQSFSGWVDNQVENDINDAILRSYRFKVHGQPTEALSLDLLAWRSRDSFGAPSISNDDGRQPSTFLPQPITTDYDAYGLRIGYEFSKFDISSMTSYLDYNNGSFLDLAVAGLPNSPIFTGLDSRVFSEELILSSTHGGSWRWSAGVFYREAKDRLAQDIPAILNSDNGNASQSHAVFGEVTRLFLDSTFELTAGLRYFNDDVLSRQNKLDLGETGVPLYHAEDSFGAVTPRVVLTWHPTADAMVYASYSEGFRSGFPQDSSVAKRYPGFPPLEPDKLHNYEIGSKADLFDGRVSMDVALYYLDWQKVQQYLGVTFGNGFCCVTAFVNGTSASGVGTDFGARFRPLDGLEMSANFSWNDLKFDQTVFSNNRPLFNKGSRLNFSSKYTVSAAVDYAVNFGDSGFAGKFSASANRVAKQQFQVLGAGTSGENWTLARTSFSLISPHRWTAMLFVDNVFNEDGATTAGPVFTAEWTNRPRPRTVGVQVEYSFGGGR